MVSTIDSEASPVLSPVENEAASAPAPSLVAHVAAPEISVFRHPGGRDLMTSFTMRGIFREPRVFLIRERRGRWLRVLLPIRPNGTEGWIRSQDVEVTRHRFAVRVDLSERRLTLTRGARVVLRRSVAVGGSGSPTPPGLFFTTILATATDPSGPYGPVAYGLSGFSAVFTEFAGGNGQIAIHGTNAPHLIGQAVSAGCVRMRNEDVVRLAHVAPLGTPVRIVR